MDLDFETDKYDLFDDWHPNKTKQEFTQKLQQQAQIEKTQLPQLLSREDQDKKKAPKSALSKPWLSATPTS